MLKCYACTSANDCTKCATGYYLNKAAIPNECVTECPPKTTKNDTTKMCTPNPLEYAQFRKANKFYNYYNLDIYQAEISPEF